MKSKSKKITNKEIAQNQSIIYREIGQLGQIANSIGTMVVEYIDYKGDKDGFAEHCTQKEAKRQDEQHKEA